MKKELIYRKALDNEEKIIKGLKEIASK